MLRRRIVSDSLRSLSAASRSSGARSFGRRRHLIRSASELDVGLLELFPLQGHRAPGIQRRRQLQLVRVAARILERDSLELEAAPDVRLELALHRDGLQL